MMFTASRRYLLSILLAAVASMGAAHVSADSKEKIDTGSLLALQTLRQHAPQASELLDKAAGVLVFPDVVKLGFGVGGQYGEGSLLVEGMPNSYFVTAGSTFGLKADSQVKSEVILFMTKEALRTFQNSRGWRVGIDGSVALIKFGAGGSIDTRTVSEPVVGFIFSNEGLVQDLTMEGTKITRIAR